MKKVISILLVLVLMFSLVACNENGNSSGGNGDKDQDSTQSKSYPNKPIQIIVPVKAGGDTDYNARVLAVALEKALGSTVVVTNIEGGATVMAMNHVMDSDPDGHTILVNGTDQFVPEMLGNTKLTLTSFKTAGIPLIDNSTVLAVHKDSHYTTLPDLVKEASNKPEEVEYGMKIGATNQIAGVAMDTKWGTKFNHVDVGNNADKMVALLARQTDVININYGLAEDYFTSGEFVPVALLGSEKNPTLADVPLASDYELENIDFSKFFWLGMHPDTPDEIVDTFAKALKEATEDEEYIQKMEERYLTIRYMGPKEAEEFAVKMYEENMLPYKEEFLKRQ